MKIYCNRDNRSDDDIFTSLVGKDVWIKIHCNTSKYTLIKGDLWVRILHKYDISALSKCDYNYDMYIVNWINDNFTDESGTIRNFSGEFIEERMNSKDLMSTYFVSIIKPTETLTTQELFNLDDENLL